MSTAEGQQAKTDTFKEDIKKRLEQASKMTPEELKFSYKGILYPTILCSKETFQAMEKMEAREDDVLIVTYPKCGKCVECESFAEWESVILKLNCRQTS